MKKIVFITMIAVAALGVIGCGEDEGTTLKWRNDGTGVNLGEIKWKKSGSIDADQTWADIADNTTSDPKGIEVLSGTTEAQDEFGGVATLDLSAGSGVISAAGQSAVVEEDADATLVITSAK